jgi:hypothetical protein
MRCIGLSFERIKEAWNFMATVLSATVFVTLLAALFLPGRRTPLAGTLSTCGGLAPVIAFYVALEVPGAPNEELETGGWSCPPAREPPRAERR